MEAMNGIPPQIPGYTFAQKLGSGSEANVYLYQQLSPSRQVAIKVSKGTLDPRAAARFRSEANFMGRISSHPYILSVYESGITATGNGYTVFEYAPGGNYKTFLESNRLNADQMLTVGINLASALSTAHREGIIHRDIKPSNILINTHGMPMLADFGIAGTIYGRPGIGYTIAWAPPEVLAKNGGGNESSDIYSLGATLFAMLTGQSPYEYGSTVKRTLQSMVKKVLLNGLDPIGWMNGIWYEITEHEAVYNMEDLSHVEIPYPEADAKNLFVRDDKKQNYYFITVRGDKRVDLKAFRKKNQTRPLSFASLDDLMQIMNLVPGAVTPLGILNDIEKRVKVFLDGDLLKEPGLVGVYPNDNTATIWMKTEDLIHIIRNHGNEVTVVERIYEKRNCFRYYCFSGSWCSWLW